MVRIGLLAKVRFEQTFESDKRVCHVAVYLGKEQSEKEKIQDKVPKVGACPVCSRNLQGAVWQEWSWQEDKR